MNLIWVQLINGRVIRIRDPEMGVLNGDGDVVIYSEDYITVIPRHAIIMYRYERRSTATEGPRGKQQKPQSSQSGECAQTVPSGERNGRGAARDDPASSSILSKSDLPWFALGFLVGFLVVLLL